MGVDPPSCNKLYIRLPVKIKDEIQIRDLHPNIIQVHIPRQKSRRWCFVDFENKQKLEEAIGDLKKLRIDNKRIKVHKYKRGAKKNKSTVQNSTKPLLKLLKKST